MRSCDHCHAVLVFLCSHTLQHVCVILVFTNTCRCPTVCSRLQPTREVSDGERANRFLNLIFQEFGNDHAEQATLQEEVHTLENQVATMDERLRISSDLQHDTNRLIQDLVAKVSSLQDTVNGLSEELRQKKA